MLALILLAERTVVAAAVYGLAFSFSVFVKPSVSQPADVAAPAAINDVAGFFCGLPLTLLVIIIFKRRRAGRRSGRGLGCISVSAPGLALPLLTAVAVVASAV